MSYPISQSLQRCISSTYIPLVYKVVAAIDTRALIQGEEGERRGLCVYFATSFYSS